jgi:predicted metal-dependent HD superfamily phosphohydrolase
MLSFYDLVRKNDFPPEPSCSPEEDQAILLSTFFHDAVYDVHSGTNEEDSAKLFESFCDEIGLDASNSSLRLLVVDYILATKKHEVVADNPLAQRLFLDLDITVLGKEWQAYCQYAALIRKEYSYVGKPVYCEKRADILESFLLNPIYGTQVMRQAFEDQARSNLRQEIKSLRNGVIPGEDE